MIVKEELDGTGVDDIGNLEDLLRIVFIYEECGNLKVFVDGGKLTRNINKKKKPGVLHAFYKRFTYLKGSNFCENLFSRMKFFDISRELIFAIGQILEISREQIFANEAISNILRELIFANEQIFFFLFSIVFR